ncbi:MAG: heat-inducible transcriptional repressor HrcA [Actinomycetota bacterium]|nr:heat-inducible transcriptional repressor HrcA [Actinomycetota bacterium]
MLEVDNSYLLGDTLAANTEDRRAQILRAVVESYITSAEPIGSAQLATMAGIAVSSATIRNDMSYLEQEGYLAQPHTSSGRVPTERGYRRYVDELMPMDSTEEEKRSQIEEFFNVAHGELEHLLGSTTKLLTNITDCAAVVTGPSPQRAPILKVQYVAISKNALLCVVIDVNGSVEKATIPWPLEMSELDLAELSDQMTAHFVGKEPGKVDSPPEVDRDGDRVKLAFLGVKEALDGAERDGIYLSGASKVAASFDAVDTVRSVISILERQYLVVSLIRSVISKGQSVAIGSENGISSLKECTVVAFPYTIDGVAMGSVGLIGPTRMKYGSVIGAVELVSENLSKRLSEG